MIKRIKSKLQFSSFALKVFIILFLSTAIIFYSIFLWIKSGYETSLRNEHCQRIVQTISKGEESINSVFDKMIELSNIIVFDERLRASLSDKNSSYYDNNKAFDSAVSQLIINNFIDIEEVKMTVFDAEERMYANWGVGFEDYSFLLEQEWVKQCQEEKGHIFWDLFSKGYAYGEENENCISLARSIYSDGTSGDYLGVLIISADKNTLSEVLSPYLFDSLDSVYICGDSGEALLAIDGHDGISEQLLAESVRKNGNRKDGWEIITASDVKYLVTSYKIERPSVLDLDALHVIHFTNYSRIEAQVTEISKKMNYSLILGLFVSLIISMIVSRYIVRPINILAREIENYSIDSQADRRLDMYRNDEIGRLNRSYKMMSEKIKHLFDDLNHAYEIKEKYRYESLRAQINPHFLFNTLNTIRLMAIIRKADNITHSIDALAGMLNYSMNKDSEIVPLWRELENIENYVFIQNCRYGEKYKIEIDIGEDIKKLKVIRFILQPIVENAMIHGFKNYKGIGRIKIYGRTEDDLLKLYVEDNGAGMNGEQLKKLDSQKEACRNGEKLTGIGFANVNERIRVEYGDEYGLNIESQPGKGVCVIYTLPVIC